MLPFVHLAVGYLCYAAYARRSRDDSPAGAPTIVAVFAAALPDLLDKPLAAFGVVPVGRTLGHSLLFALPLVAIVRIVARRRGGPIAGDAFAVGYLSHIATDIPWHLLSGEYQELGFLLWPIAEMPAYTGTKPLGTVAGIAVTTLWIETAILIAGVVRWWRDGRPGTGRVRRE